MRETPIVPESVDAVGGVQWRRGALEWWGWCGGHPADSGMVASHLSSQSNPKLLTLMRSKLRLGHHSPRTEQAYVGWVIRFVRHHRVRHPAELGEQDVMAFLRHLAEERRVAVATQGQAVAALLFLYRHVLGRPLRLEGHLPRARQPGRARGPESGGPLGRGGSPRWPRE